MTWTDPTTRSTGDLITAAIWNQDVVDNLQYLHDRDVVLWAIDQAEDDVFSSGYRADRLQSTGEYAFFSFYIPDDFETLLYAHLLHINTSAITGVYNIQTWYHNPTQGEGAWRHGASATGLTVPLQANTAAWSDFSSYVGELAGGDLLSVRVQKSTSDHYVLGARLIYRRS